MIATSQKVEPIEVFSQAIKHEFIQGSAIAPNLFQAAVEIHSDLEFDSTGEPITPIHDALGWRYVRFGYQVKTSLYGAFLKNEDGSTWQIKLSNPLTDGDGKTRKYERAKGSGSTPYLPPVDPDTRKRIGQRYSISVPAGGSFWAWAFSRPELPLIITEGGKKALALLSQGYIAVALLGVNGGYRSIKDEQGQTVERQIIPELLPALASDRSVFLAFDQDSKSETRHRVAIATARFGALLEAHRCKVKVAVWKPSQGKGIDDLIVNCGAGAVYRSLSDAVSLQHWQWQHDYQQLYKLSYQPALTLNQRYIGELSIPDSEKLIGIKSPKGTGKTETLVPIVQNAIANGQWVLLLSHRVQLAQDLCNRFGLPYVTEIRSEGTFLGYGLCIDSLHPKSQARFNAEGWSNGVVIIDESEQVVWHALNSATCKKERVAILGQFRQLLTNVMASPSGRVILSDADLSDYSIRFIQGMASSKVKPWIVRNDYQFSEPWDVFPYDSREALLSELLESLRAGQRALVLTCSQKAKSKFSTQTLEKEINKRFPALRVLRIDSETVADKTHPAYGCVANLNKVLSGYDVVIASPTIETGVSIDLRGHFNGVWAFMAGNLPENSARQFLARLREPVARHIFAERYGRIGMIADGSTSTKELLKCQHKTHRVTIHQLEDADLQTIDTEFDRTALLTWAAIATRINAGQYHYRDSLLWSLEDEGHTIHESEAGDGDLNGLKDALALTRDENRLELAELTAVAPKIDEATYRKLEQKREHTRAELHQLQRYEIERKYCTDSPDAELVQKDEDGWFPRLRLHYFLSVGKPYLKQHDRSKIETLTHDGKLWSPDSNRATLSAKITAFELIGITAEFIDAERAYRGTDEDVQEITTNAIAHRRELKSILGLTISDGMKPIQILKALLGKFGLDLRCDGRNGRGGQRWYRLQNLNDGRLEIFNRWIKHDKKLLGQVAEKPIVAPTPLIRSITPPLAKSFPESQPEKEAVGQLAKWGTGLSHWLIRRVEGAIATIELNNIYGIHVQQVPLDELKIV